MTEDSDKSYIIRVQGKVKPEELALYKLIIWDQNPALNVSISSEKESSSLSTENTLKGQITQVEIETETLSIQQHDMQVSTKPPVEMNISKPSKNPCVYPVEKEKDTSQSQNNTASDSDSENDELDQHFLSIIPIFSSNGNRSHDYQFWLHNITVIVQSDSSVLSFPIDTSQAEGFKYKSECRKLLKQHVSVDKSMVQQIKHLQTVDGVHQYLCILNQIPDILPNILHCSSPLKTLCYRNFYLPIPMEYSPEKLLEWYQKDSTTDKYSLSEPYKPSCTLSLKTLIPKILV